MVITAVVVVTESAASVFRGLRSSRRLGRALPHVVLTWASRVLSWLGPREARLQPRQSDSEVIGHSPRERFRRSTLSLPW